MLTGTQSGSNLFLYTSAYANFSMEVMPQGSVNMTGILPVYNNQWEVDCSYLKRYKTK